MSSTFVVENNGNESIGGTSEPKDELPTAGDFIHDDPMSPTSINETSPEAPDASSANITDGTSALDEAEIL